MIRGDEDDGKQTPGKVMLFAPPLGQCGFGVYEPIMAKYGSEYTYITWDYRGLHGSDDPKRTRRISIPMHTEDGIRVLKAATRGGSADVMVGHSMGVQVALETVLVYPELVDSLVLLNGAHGHVFSTAFQPVFRIPFVGDFAFALVQTLLKQPKYIANARKIMKPTMDYTLPLFGKFLGSKLLCELLGDTYMKDFFNEYLGGVCTSDKTMKNFLRLFQELDAHSVHHLLGTIQHPTLIVTGLWDTLTPSYHGDEMARLMTNARHVCDVFSSHATLLEHPELVIFEMDQFLSTSVKKVKRKNSTVFETKSSARSSVVCQTSIGTIDDLG